MTVGDLLSKCERESVASGYHAIRIYRGAKMLYNIEAHENCIIPFTINRLEVKSFGYSLGSKGFYVNVY